MARVEAEAYDGLSKVAHAIRRSSALTVAMQMTPPESSVEEMLELADRLAVWIGGDAARQEDETPARQPLGQSWPPPAD